MCRIVATSFWHRWFHFNELFHVMNGSRITNRSMEAIEIDSRPPPNKTPFWLNFLRMSFVFVIVSMGPRTVVWIECFLPAIQLTAINVYCSLITWQHRFEFVSWSTLLFEQDAPFWGWTNFEWLGWKMKITCVIQTVVERLRVHWLSLKVLPPPPPAVEHLSWGGNCTKIHPYKNPSKIHPHRGFAVTQKINCKIEFRGNEWRFVLWLQ